MKKTNDDNGSVATLRAARAFTRRRLLQTAAAGAGVAAVGPWYVRDAFSSSGELSLINWADELPGDTIADFTKKTGIKVKSTPFSQNEEQINKLQATGGSGFDLCQPTHDRSPQFKDLGLLAPLDESKLALDALLPGIAKISETDWRWDGKLYHTPHTWGSEALSWRTDLTKLEYGKASYGTLWEEQYKGKVQGRPHSLLLGIGLWMDGAGKLPSNRMLDAFKDEDSFKKIYDQLLKFAIEHKPWIKQFWDSADNTKSGLLENGVVIGQTWDGPALSLKKDGKPVSYMAPKEGAISWLDGWSLLSEARNKEQAYEWIKYVHGAETSAKVADGSGYNPVVKGSSDLLSAAAKKNFEEAYPDDALSKLWSRPAEPSWFADLRTQYAEKFKAA